MPLEQRGDIGTFGHDPEALFAGIGNQRLDQPGGHPASANRRRNQRMIGDPCSAARDPGQPADRLCPFDMGAVFPGLAAAMAGDRDLFHRVLLDADHAALPCKMAMQFLSDNAAAVHPAVWEAMRAADAPDVPYDGDALSQALDAAFSGLFGRDCAVLWVASGTAANCLALAAMVPPHGGVICHREAHIEHHEGGAPGFYTHGAKLILGEGDGARLSPAEIERIRARIQPGDVHEVQPHAVSITQTSEMGCTYRPEEIAAIAATAARLGLRLHIDGARFANAVAFLGCAPWQACAGADTLSFGCIKNGGMSAEALVFFDPALADHARWQRKRAGHLQSKGRFLAAQVLAMVEGGLWLDNARAANAAAQELAAAAGARLLHPVEANEVFLKLTPAERQALRGQGFSFYDWGDDAARLVTAWNANPDHVAALARAIAAL